MARDSLLLIGPLPIEGDQLGGAKVSFRQMVVDLEKQADVSVSVVNLSRPMSGRGSLGRLTVGIRAAGSIAFALFRRGRTSDVWVLNCSSGGVFTVFPLVWVLAALMRRPLVLRAFGGNLDERYDRANSAGRRVFMAMARRCRAVVLETDALIIRFQSLGNVKRLPNTRSLPPGCPPRARCSRLIFLGQIRRQKGIEVLLDAMDGLSELCHVDCFGSPIESGLVHRLERQAGVDYRGEIDPGSVGEVFGGYDALVLPTFWHGEGLPGVVVEAFQCGRPVIASDWRRIPEVVRDGDNGLLVEPRSVQALRVAITRLVDDDELYGRLCNGARTSGDALRSDVWHARFVDWCRP